MPTGSRLSYPFEHLIDGRHRFRSDPDFNAFFAKHLAGIKDSAGNKRKIIVEEGDDLKSIIENSIAGQHLYLLKGDHTVSEPITYPSHPLFIDGQPGARIVVDYAGTYLWANTSGNPPDGSNDTIIRNITFTSTSGNWARFRAKRWYLYNCKFEGLVSPYGFDGTRLKHGRIDLDSNQHCYWTNFIAEDCYINSIRLWSQNNANIPNILRDVEYIYEATIHLGGNLLIIGGYCERGISISARDYYSPRPALFAFGVKIGNSGLGAVCVDTIDKVTQDFPYVYLINCIIKRNDKILNIWETYVHLKKFVLQGCYLEPVSADLNIIYNDGTIDHAIIAYNTGDDSSYNINLDTSKATLCEFDMNSGITIT